MSAEKELLEASRALEAARRLFRSGTGAVQEGAKAGATIIKAPVIMQTEEMRYNGQHNQAQIYQNNTAAGGITSAQRLQNLQMQAGGNSFGVQSTNTLPTQPRINNFIGLPESGAPAAGAIPSAPPSRPFTNASGQPSPEVFQAYGQLTSMMAAANAFHARGDVAQRDAMLGHAKQLVNALPRDELGFVVEPVPVGRQATVVGEISGLPLPYRFQASDNRTPDQLLADMAMQTARIQRLNPIPLNVIAQTQGAAGFSAAGVAATSPASQAGTTVGAERAVPIGTDPKKAMATYIDQLIEAPKTGKAADVSVLPVVDGKVTLPEGPYPTGVPGKNNQPVTVMIPPKVILKPEYVQQYVLDALKGAGLEVGSPKPAPAAATGAAVGNAAAGGAAADAARASGNTPPTPAPAGQGTQPAANPAPAAPAAAAKPVEVQAATGAPATAYSGIKKDDMPTGLKQDQVKDVQEALKKAGLDIGKTGVDGKWGEKSQAALLKAAHDAGIKNIKDIDFSNPNDPEFKQLMTHLGSKAAPAKGPAAPAPAKAPAASATAPAGVLEQMGGVAPVNQPKAPAAGATAPAGVLEQMGGAAPVAQPETPAKTADLAPKAAHDRPVSGAFNFPLPPTAAAVAPSAGMERAVEQARGAAPQQVTTAPESGSQSVPIAQGFTKNGQSRSFS